MLVAHVEHHFFNRHMALQWRGTGLWEDTSEAQASRVVGCGRKRGARQEVMLMMVLLEMVTVLVLRAVMMSCHQKPACPLCMLVMGARTQSQEVEGGWEVWRVLVQELQMGLTAMDKERRGQGGRRQRSSHCTAQRKEIERGKTRTRSCHLKSF